MASGHFIAFLDAGDWWEPRKLELQLQRFHESGEGCGIVFCAARMHPSLGVPYVLQPKRSQDWVKELLLRQPITGSSSAVVIRRSILEKTGWFFEEYDLPEDRDLWLRIAMIADMDFVSAPLTNLEILERSRRYNLEEKKVTYLRFIERYQDELRKRGLLNCALAHYHATIANLCFRAGSRREGLAETLTSLKLSFRWRIMLRATLALVTPFTNTSYGALLSKLKSIGNTINKVHSH
jgi:hypothetical protein